MGGKGGPLQAAKAKAFKMAQSIYELLFFV